jgi:hypothetical protein
MKFYKKKRMFFCPCFSALVKPVVLERFSHALDVIWGGYFFDFKKYSSADFWLFYLKDKRYKENKKPTHPE